jgi:hypothetical protein
MLRSTLSWVLVLIALGLALSVPSLIANGNASPEPIKSNPALPAARDKEKENKPDSQAQEAQHSPAPSSEATIVIRNQPPENQKERAKTEPENTVPRRTQEGWNWGSVADWALVTLAIITAILALRSLSDIATQAKASVKAADAAEKTYTLAITRVLPHFHGRLS